MRRSHCSLCAARTQLALAALAWYRAFWESEAISSLKNGFGLSAAFGVLLRNPPVHAGLTVSQSACHRPQAPFATTAAALALISSLLNGPDHGCPRQHALFNFVTPPRALVFSSGDLSIDMYGVHPRSTTVLFAAWSMPAGQARDAADSLLCRLPPQSATNCRPRLLAQYVSPSFYRQ